MAYQGTVKNYNPHKGWGFITSPEGEDIFMHVSGCIDGGVPVADDQVAFDMAESQIKPGMMQAVNIIGCSGAPGSKGSWGKGGGAYSGTVKSVVPEKGFGFILGDNGVDLFFHMKGVVDGCIPVVGDSIKFDLEASSLKPGQMQAGNITGGSGGSSGGERALMSKGAKPMIKGAMGSGGCGKAKGKGGKDWKGGCGPYGGGMGKGSCKAAAAAKGKMNKGIPETVGKGNGSLDMAEMMKAMMAQELSDNSTWTQQEIDSGEADPSMIDPAAMMAAFQSWGS